MTLCMMQGVSPHFYFLAFSAGVIAHKFVEELPKHGPVVCIFIGFFVFAFSSKICRIFALIILGFVWANLVATQTMLKSIPHNLEKKDLVATGKILGVPVKSANHVRFDFAIESLKWNGRVIATPGRVRLKAYENLEEFKANQFWQLNVRLKRSRGYQNPGSKFNYETYLFERRIRATGYVRSNALNQLLSDSVSYYSVSKFREEVKDFLNLRFHDHRHSGILTALIVGIRGNMSDSDWRTLQSTGTIHLVAISGLHIGLISSLVVLLVIFFMKLATHCHSRVPVRYVAIIFGVVAGFAYAFLAGMTIPTKRAVTMLCVVAIFLLTKKTFNSIYVLALTLAVVLFIDPLSPLSNGFWLSFGAVVIISFSLEKQLGTTQQNVKYQFWLRIKSWLTIQIAILLGLMPVLIVLFNQASLIAPIANMFAIPAIGIVVIPIALFGLVVYFAGFAELSIHFFGLALDVIGYVWLVLEYLGDLPYALWQPAIRPLWITVCAGIGVVVLIFRRVLPSKIIAFLLFCPYLFFQPAKLDHGQFIYTMLEVGQGLASVIQTRNHVLIYDAGPAYRNGIDTGKIIVVPYLQALGVKKIDRLIVSHEHNDHSGGYSAIVDSYDVIDKMTGTPEKISMVGCDNGVNWIWDGVEFEVLWPIANSITSQFKSGNNASCVIKVSSSFGSIMLTGDIEEEVERILVKTYGDDFEVDVIQVPHHGSKTSSSKAFLKKADPDFALISSGYKNRFNHPSPKVLNRYSDAGVDVLNTAKYGAITLNFKPEFEILLERNKQIGYWFYNHLFDQ